MSDESDDPRRELLVTREPEIFSLAPRNLQEALDLAKHMADSDYVPKQFKGKPGDCLIAMQMGAELGVKPMASLRGIGVINGRPCIYGDLMWGLVRSHPLCEKVAESYNASTQTATCMVKRRGAEPTIRTFSQADAVKARLWNKEGPWQQYPLRMLQWRARGYASRDAIPEALQGLPTDFEARDMPEIDVTPGQDERLEAEMSIRRAVSLDGLQAAYEALTTEDQTRLVGLVVEMKRKLAGAAKQDKPAEPDPARDKPIDMGSVERERAPDIHDVRLLLKKGDFDAAADLASSFTDQAMRKLSLDEVNKAAAAATQAANISGGPKK